MDIACAHDTGPKPHARPLQEGQSPRLKFCGPFAAPGGRWTGRRASAQKPSCAAVPPPCTPCPALRVKAVTFCPKL